MEKNAGLRRGWDENACMGAMGIKIFITRAQASMMKEKCDIVYFNFLSIWAGYKSSRAGLKSKQEAKFLRISHNYPAARFKHCYASAPI